MVDKSDVLLDPYRPGVLEKLGLSPESLLERNPRLIVARLSGWGHTGPLATAPGHDLNYLSLTGVLSTIAKNPDDVPYPPHNLLADMAGGGLMCAMGILMCVIERYKSGKGQVIDAAMVDGVVYLSSFLFNMELVGRWNNDVGRNLLDSGAYFYNIYKCRDGRFVTVACLEPRFYSAFLTALVPHLTETHRESVLEAKQYEEEKWGKNKNLFVKVFSTKTRDEWVDIVLFIQFHDRDACVTPVLTPLEAAVHPHNVARQTFTRLPTNVSAFPFVPQPAPKLSRTPGVSPPFHLVSVGEHSLQVLGQFGVPGGLVAQYKALSLIRKLA